MLILTNTYMLTPSQTIQAAANAGAKKAKLTSSGADIGRFAVASLLAGVYISLGGILSLTIGFGFPEITQANPGLQKLLSGCMFPIGLILVVILGAELFTGNNALLIPSAIRGDHSWGAVVKNWVLVYAGNLVGALGFTYFFVYCCGLTKAEPYHTAAISLATAKVSMTWWVVFLKGIGANWCVCMAVWLALSAKSVTAKMLGCWLPVMAFVALGYEHSIANMFFIPLGMMEGAQIGIWQAITANFIPATIGNIIGGALMVGTAYSYIHFKQLKNT